MLDLLELPTPDTLEAAPVWIYARLVMPGTGYGWNIAAGRRLDDGDWMLFGFMEGTGRHIGGYFRLSELRSLQGPFSLRVTEAVDFTPYAIMGTPGLMMDRDSGRKVPLPVFEDPDSAAART